MATSLSIATYASLAAYYVEKVASIATKLGSQIPPASAGGPPYPSSAGNGGGVDPDGPTITIATGVILITTPHASASVVGAGAIIGTITITCGAYNTPSITTLSL